MQNVLTNSQLLAVTFHLDFGLERQHVAGIKHRYLHRASNIIQAHSREARGISMRVVDSVEDGTGNWNWTGVSLDGNASEGGQIKRFLLTPTIKSLDSFFANHSAFNNGMEFG